MANPTLNTYNQSFQTSSVGMVSVTGILNVEAYNTINLEIVAGPHAPAGMTVQCIFGQISGETLAQVVSQFPLGSATEIHTFNVVGPEFNLELVGGPPNTAVPIQAWVFLH